VNSINGATAQWASPPLYCTTREPAKCVQYNGTMSQDARSESLKKFENHSNIKVLIASLKCGGVGLNLTMASRVICVDLWWNSAIEQQGKTPCTCYMEISAHH